MGRDALTDQDVLAHLGRARAPVSLREIAHALELQPRARRALHGIVARLQRSGEIEEVRSGRYRLASGTPGTKSHRRRSAGVSPALAPTASGTRALSKDPNLLTGRLVAHRDGYGFVVPDQPVPEMEGDLFVGRDNLGDEIGRASCRERV